MAFSAKAAARYILAAAAAIVLPASIVAAASLAHPAHHSASRHAARVMAGPTPGTSGGVPQPGPVVMRPASVAPRGAFNRILSARQAATAAQACAGYATYAGWTNNALSDDLVTASAICVAESGGQPTVYYCNPTGQDGYYPPVSCSGMYDRGLWQIDNQAWTSITDTCAFAAKCNADGAYAISQRGASFSPWATYTSGVAGVCLSRVGYAQDAAAVTSACGSGAGKQQWRVAGRAIRDGKYCLAVASSGKTAAVHLRQCNGSSYQQWTALGNGLLRNALASRCLRDPNGTTTPGTPVNVGSCVLAASRVWWLP